MLIIGCGNRQRGDDGAGLLAAEKLRDLGIPAVSCSGQTADLIEAWSGDDDVIVVDAVVTGAPPGSVQTWDAAHMPRSAMASASTHGLGVAEAIELARILGRLPARLRIFGIEGRQFDPGAGVSAALTAGIAETVSQIIEAVAGEHPVHPAPPKLPAPW